MSATPLTHPATRPTASRALLARPVTLPERLHLVHLDTHILLDTPLHAGEVQRLTWAWESGPALGCHLVEVRTPQRGAARITPAARALERALRRAPEQAALLVLHALHDARPPAPPRSRLRAGVLALALTAAPDAPARTPEVVRLAFELAAGAVLESGATPPAEALLAAAVEAHSH